MRDHNSARTQGCREFLEGWAPARLIIPLCLWLMAFHAGVAAQSPDTSNDPSPESNAAALKIKGALVKISQSINIPVESGGVLLELSVREGQLVKKGDLIGRLNDNDLQIQFERAARI